MSASLTLVMDQYHDVSSVLPINAATCFYFNSQLSRLEDSLRPVSLPMVRNLWWNDDDKGAVEVKVDRYGDPLMYVPAHLLVPHLRAVASNAWEIAAINFIEALPPDTPVVLWWH